MNGISQSRPAAILSAAMLLPMGTSSFAEEFANRGRGAAAELRSDGGRQDLWLRRSTVLSLRKPITVMRPAAPSIIRPSISPSYQIGRAHV